MRSSSAANPVSGKRNRRIRAKRESSQADSSGLRSRKPAVIGAVERGGKVKAMAVGPGPKSPSSSPVSDLTSRGILPFHAPEGSLQISDKAPLRPCGPPCPTSPWITPSSSDTHTNTIDPKSPSLGFGAA